MEKGYSAVQFEGHQPICGGLAAGEGDPEKHREVLSGGA